MDGEAVHDAAAADPSEVIDVADFDEPWVDDVTECFFFSLSCRVLDVAADFDVDVAVAVEAVVDVDCFLAAFVVVAVFFFSLSTHSVDDADTARGLQPSLNQ